MADRFPLIVNPTSKKIEELVSGDNLNLTGNGIVANNGLGISGQYLKSTGSTVIWDSPGDVYLTATQTISNKTFTTCTLSGSTNIFSNIPNTALVNSSINVNGVSIPLGGSVTTPDNNTTYSISALDGTTGKKIIRLTSGGNSGAGVNDDVTLAAGSNVTLSRSGDEIVINSSYIDTDTVTRVQSAVGGTLISGDITIAATGSSTVSQSGNVITISSTYIDTITRLRGGTGQTFASGDFTFLEAGATTITQSGGDITISSQDTITRLKGGGAGSFVTGDVTVTGGGSTTVSQTGNTITVSSTDTDTVTRVRGTTSGIYTSGDITFTASGAATVSQTGSTINISSVNTDTTYSADVNGGIVLSGTAFALKNSANFTDSRILKWDNSNKQLTNSIISDNGSTVTINGDFKVTGTTTTINTTTLVVSDNEVELRRGNNLVGSDGGIRLNRTTNSSGVAQTFTSLQWFESGGFWRVYDGSISRRLVTETESQTLTNKTLTSPILTTPSLGIATATSINGLTITTVASGTLTIGNSKTLTVNNSVTLSAANDTSTVNFRSGGNVTYTADTLAVFASTTSTQLRGVISDSTGVGVLVFNQNPVVVDSVTTSSTSFALLNTTATSIAAFGAATSITMGANGTGTTTIRNGLTVNKSVTLGQVVGDTLTINSTVDFVNADIVIRGTSANPIRVGRGGNAIATNTRVGFSALQGNTTGSQNTAMGYEAALSLTAGAASTAVGYRALRNANVGTSNTAFGRDAALNLINGNKNTAVGVSALSENQSGEGNVCIGHFAGYNCLGTGNVLIGPADDENSTNSTYQPPSISGNRQLVIGSGTGTWIRGDNNFDVTAPQNFNVGGNLIVSGNLTINGTTTTINSSTISVDDKTIEIGAVVNTTFVANVTNNSANITGITPTSGLIPGMVVTITTAGLSVPAGTTIVSITNNTAVLSNNVSGASGTATFNAVGPSDTSADGGGVVLRGTTNKSITWSDTTDAWTSTEHLDLAAGKQYRIGNVLIASSSQIGPSTGTFSLGGGVTASSLTSVGTLTSLTVSGAANFNSTGIASSGSVNLTSADPFIRYTVSGGTADQSKWDVRAFNNSGGYFAIRTVNDANTVFTERMNIRASTGDVTINTGNLVIGTAGKGIDFSAFANAAGMTSEVLSDYEEGTWTATIATESGSNYTIASQTCKYVKIGRTCVIQVDISFSAEGSGTIAVIDLPFVADSSNTHIFNGFVTSGNNNRSIQLTPYTSGSVLIRFDDGTQYINYWTPNTGWAPTNSFKFTGSYITSA